MAASPSSPLTATSAATADCVVCLDELSGTCGRTIVTLQCSHRFHLDCIGSTFNSFGAMRCPLCRAVEDGNWTVPVETASDQEEEEFEFDHDEWECLDFLGVNSHPYQARWMVSSSPPMTMVCGVIQQPLSAVHANHYRRFYSQASTSRIHNQLNHDLNQPGFQPPSFASNENQVRTAYQTRLPSSSHSNGAVPAALPLTSMPNQAVIANTSVSNPAVLQHGSSSSGPTPWNVPWWMLPYNHSPSPAMHTMMSGQHGYNGLPERVSADNSASRHEQRRYMSSNVPPNAPSNPEHADNAASRSERIQYLFNVPLNAPNNREQPGLPMVNQELRNDLGPPGDSPGSIDLNLNLNI